MCDASLLFFSVLFQQRHPIPVVNKTVLFKNKTKINIPFGSTYPLQPFKYLVTAL